MSLQSSMQKKKNLRVVMSYSIANLAVYIPSFLFLLRHEYITLTDTSWIGILSLKNTQLRELYPIFLIFSLIFLFKCLSITTYRNFIKNFQVNNNYPKSDYIRIGKLVLLTSHHEGEFKLHEVMLKGKRLCAGCYGSALGLAIILALSPYLILINPDPQTLPFRLILMIVSFVFTETTLIKYAIEITGILRILMNALYPIGITIFYIALIDVPYSYVLIILFTMNTFAARIHLTHLVHKSSFQDIMPKSERNSLLILEENKK